MMNFTVHPLSDSQSAELEHLIEGGFRTMMMSLLSGTLSSSLINTCRVSLSQSASLHTFSSPPVLPPPPPPPSLLLLLLLLTTIVAVLLRRLRCCSVAQASSSSSVRP